MNETGAGKRTGDTQLVGRCVRPLAACTASMPNRSRLRANIVRASEMRKQGKTTMDSGFEVCLLTRRHCCHENNISWTRFVVKCGGMDAPGLSGSPTTEAVHRACTQANVNPSIWAFRTNTRLALQSLKSIRLLFLDRHGFWRYLRRRRTNGLVTRMLTWFVLAARMPSPAPAAAPQGARCISGLDDPTTYYDRLTSNPLVSEDIVQRLQEVSNSSQAHVASVRKQRCARKGVK